MIKRLAMALACTLGSFAIAQSADASGGRESLSYLSYKRLSVAATLASSRGDYRAYTQKELSLGAELDYTLTSADPWLGSRAYLGFIRNAGSTHQVGSSQWKRSLHGFRLGGDVLFETPVKGLQAYAGLNLNWWDGNVELKTPTLSTETKAPERKAKFGYRIGVEFKFIPALSISFDYNQSEWIHSADISTKPISGVNPINPRWAGLSIRYHFM